MVVLKEILATKMTKMIPKFKRLKFFGKGGINWSQIGD